METIKTSYARDIQIMTRCIKGGSIAILVVQVVVVPRNELAAYSEVLLLWYLGSVVFTGLLLQSVYRSFEAKVKTTYLRNEDTPKFIKQLALSKEHWLAAAVSFLFGMGCLIGLYWNAWPYRNFGAAYEASYWIGIVLSFLAYLASYLKWRCIKHRLHIQESTP